MLQNDIALVTGASRGIGQAIAKALAGAGARVIGTATTDAGAAGITSWLGTSGRGAVLDVGNAASIDALLSDLEARGEMPTILVNNAAITRDTLLLRMKSEDWDAVIATNLTSVFRLSKGVLKRMMKERRGRIVSLTSIVGLTGNAGQANYAAAKAGILGFTKSLAKEIASRGITVNAVAPGFIDTDMTRTLTEEQRSGLTSQVPMARLGSVDDITAPGGHLADGQLVVSRRVQRDEPPAAPARRELDQGAVLLRHARRGGRCRDARIPRGALQVRHGVACHCRGRGEG
jgi:3-oxoacyl-[acyl-carrier protein] reductase